MDNTTCYRAANKHLQLQPHHVIRIFRGVKEVETLTLAGDVTAPEDRHGIRAAAQKNQATLRNMLDQMTA
jgi:hypothetical protein